jgi:hypothetical protein
LFACAECFVVVACFGRERSAEIDREREDEDVVLDEVDEGEADREEDREGDLEEDREDGEDREDEEDREEDVDRLRFECDRLGDLDDGGT